MLPPRCCALPLLQFAGGTRSSALTSILQSSPLSWPGGVGANESRTPNPTPAPETASTSDVTFVFVTRESGPERLVCEAGLVFPQAGIIAGLKLVGFSLWRSPEGEICVTFLSRVFGAGQERRFFDYLRPVNGGGAAAKALKEAIVAAYKAASTEPTT